MKVKDDIRLMSINFDLSAINKYNILKLNTIYYESVINLFFICTRLKNSYYMLYYMLYFIYYLYIVYYCATRMELMAYRNVILTEI